MAIHFRYVMPTCAVRVRTEFVYPPIPLRQFDWSAIDDATYDGAPDSGNRNEIGYGATEEEAIADLLRLKAEAICDRCPSKRVDECDLNGGCILGRAVPQFSVVGGE